MKTKPSLDEVLAYAADRLKYHIATIASSLPWELKDEIIQEGRIRIWEKYEELDPERSWKAFVNKHSHGTVLDYLKQGKGFVEHKIGAKIKAEEKKIESGEISADSASHLKNSLRTRVELEGEDGSTLHVDEVLSINGKFHEVDYISEKIRWGLVAKMASVDHVIHLVAKVLLGFSIEEQSIVFGVSRERLSQRYHGFLAELSSPESARDPWLNQAIFALGFDENALDNGLGHDLDPIDLWSLQPIDKDRGVHKSAMAWVEDLYPDLLSVKNSNIDWELVSKLSRFDEQLHIVATILLGTSPNDICEYFDIGMNAARNKVRRFVERLDDPNFYNDPWTNQVIYALGLCEHFGQEPSQNSCGLDLVPINLTDFSIPRYLYDRGDQLSLLVFMPGQQLGDESEVVKTRSLRRVQLDRETIDDTQMDFLSSLISDVSGPPFFT